MRGIFFIGLMSILIVFCASLFFIFSPFWKPVSESSFIVEGVRQNEVKVEIVFGISPRNGPLAHYAEHLTWLPNIGKDSRPEERDTNAWTNDYAVGYWLSGPPEDLIDMLRRLKIVFDPINLPREVAETERDIILREYDWWMGNNPDAQTTEDMDAFLYEGNAIAASVIGTPEKIEELSYEAAKDFHAKTHRPERARLVVTGDVTERQLAKAMAEAGFPDLDLSRAEVHPPLFALAGLESRTFFYSDAEAAPRMIWRKVVALPEPVDFDLLEAQTALLRDILDTNLPGGLAGPLRFDAFITKGFTISIAPIDERHIELTFLAEPDQGISFSAMQTAFENALAASGEGVPAATYDRVRDRFKGFWPDWSDEEETSRWMASYTLSRVSVLREPKTARQIRKIDAQIDATDINALLGSLVGPGRTAIAFIGADSTP